MSSFSSAEDHRQFLEYFKAHVDPNDQLPVKVPSYNLTEDEINGEVVNWAQQYLLQMKCPQILLAPLITEVLQETRKSVQKIPKQCGFDGYAYNPLKLSIIVISHINIICDRLMDNAELNKILPENSNSSFDHIPHHSVKAIKNTRRKMEDRHICIRDFNGMFGIKDSEPTSFYGVFDGHGGQDAAIYTSAHLCYNIAKSNKYPQNIEGAMREAFLKTDEAFVDKSDKHAMYSGTTALACIYRAKEKRLIVGWVGDSQALLACEGKVCQIVSPHTPSIESERIRIEKMGGVIMNWDGSYRVNGQLAISRAIGDASHKPFISSDPDISSVSLDGEEDFLIIASDGLWESQSEDSIAILVYREIAKNPGCAANIADKIIESARKQTSDNITVIVVFFKDPYLIAKSTWLNKMEAVYDNNSENNVCENETSHYKNYDTNRECLSSEVTKDGLLEDEFQATSPIDLLKGNNNSDYTSDQTTADLLDTKHRFDDDFGPETDVDAVDDANIVKTPNMLTEDNSLANGVKPFSLENKIIEQLSGQHKEFLTNTNPFNDDQFDQYHDEFAMKDELMNQAAIEKSENDAELVVDNKIIDALESLGITNGEKQTHDVEDKTLDTGLVNDLSAEATGYTEKVDHSHEKNSILMDLTEKQNDDLFDNHEPIICDKENIEEQAYGGNPAASAGEESDEEDEWNYIKGDKKQEQHVEKIENLVPSAAAETVEAPSFHQETEFVGEEKSSDILAEELPSEPTPSDAFAAVGEYSETIDENKDLEAEEAGRAQEEAELIPTATSPVIPAEQEHPTQEPQTAESFDYAPLPVPRSGIPSSTQDEETICQPELPSLEQEPSNVETPSELAEHDHEEPAPAPVESQEATADEGTERPNSLSFDMASKLNPEAKEFVPTGSPTLSNPTSPVASMPELPQNSFLMLGDEVVAQSPKKGTATMDNIDVPAEDDFQHEMNNCPHELEQFAEHTNGNTNGDERSHSPASEPSYQELNLKEAMQCDEKLDNEYNDVQQNDTVENHSNELNLLGKEQNAMNMSFYEGRDEALLLSNSDELNKVQMLPSEDESSEQNNVQSVEEVNVANVEETPVLVDAKQEEEQHLVSFDQPIESTNAHTEQLPESIFSAASQVVDDVAALVGQLELEVPALNNAHQEDNTNPFELNVQFSNTTETENLVSFDQSSGLEDQTKEATVAEIPDELDVQFQQTEFSQPLSAAETDEMASPVIEVSQQEITTDNEFITDENVLDVVPSPIPATHEAPISPEPIAQNDAVEDLCVLDQKTPVEHVPEIVAKDTPVESVPAESTPTIVNEPVLEEVKPVADETATQKTTTSDEPTVPKPIPTPEPAVASLVAKTTKAPATGAAKKPATAAAKPLTKPAAKPTTAAKTSTVTAAKKAPTTTGPSSATARLSTVGSKSPKVTSTVASKTTTERKVISVAEKKTAVNGEVKTTLAQKRTVSSTTSTGAAKSSTTTTASRTTTASTVKSVAAKPLASAKPPASAKAPAPARAPVTAAPRPSSGPAKTGSVTARTSTGLPATKPRAAPTATSKTVGTTSAPSSATTAASKTLSTTKRVSSVQTTTTQKTATSTTTATKTSSATSRTSIAAKTSSTSTGLLRKTGTAPAAAAATRKPAASPIAKTGPKATAGGKPAPIKSNAITSHKETTTVSNNTKDLLDLDKQLKNDNNQLITKNGIETQMIVIDSAAD